MSGVVRLVGENEACDTGGRDLRVDLPRLGLRLQFVGHPRRFRKGCMTVQQLRFKIIWNCSVG